MLDLVAGSELPGRRGELLQEEEEEERAVTVAEWSDLSLFC